MRRCSQSEPLISPHVGGTGSRLWISSGGNNSRQSVDMRGLRCLVGTKSYQFITDFLKWEIELSIRINYIRLGLEGKNVWISWKTLCADTDC